MNNNAKKNLFEGYEDKISAILLALGCIAIIPIFAIGEPIALFMSFVIGILIWLSLGAFPFGSTSKPTAVTDTSWWLEEGWRMEKLPSGFNKLIVPSSVMRELDGLKKNPDTKDRATEATKRIAELIKEGKAQIMSPTIKPSYNTLSSKTDEEVVAVAEELKKEGQKNVTILSLDHGIHALAGNRGITAKYSTKSRSSYYSHNSGYDDDDWDISSSSSSSSSSGISVDGATGPGDDGFWDSTWR